MALCRLHNFCIEQKLERKLESAQAAPLLAQDSSDIAAHGGIPLVRHGQNNLSPDQLLHGGAHFGDLNRNLRRQLENNARREASDGMLPRERLHDIVETKELRRPPPESWRR